MTAIAAVHDEAPSFEDTDWQKVVRLYGWPPTVTSPSPVDFLRRLGRTAGAHLAYEEAGRHIGAGSPGRPRIQSWNAPM
jgi:predicted RNA polymerase sigma factor